MSLPYALQLYSVKEFTAVDFEGTVSRVKDFGYDGVELAGLCGKTITEIKDILDKVGLELVSAHLSVDELTNDEFLSEFAKTGAKYAVIPWMSVEPNKESVETCIKLIRECGEKCKKHGLQLLYHNHDFEYAVVDGKFILDTYYDEIPANLLQTEIDTCWANVGGVNPAEYLLKYSDRSPVVHLKDFVGSKSENMYALIGNSDAKEELTGAFEFRPVGYGVQNIPDIIDAAQKAGAKYLVVEMDSPALGKDSMECAKMSIDYLKSL